ncbi:MAG: hypothetical protein JXB15_14280 [Anaerolineales bacterium]|nr:hypothetical protein [Anaerolineales bacterium]
MSFENLDLGDDMDNEEGTPPEESSNRMFFIAAGILGAIALVFLICIAVYALVLLPQRKEAQSQQKATLDAQNTEVASIINKTSTAYRQEAIEAAYTATPTATSPATFTPRASATSVVAVEGSATSLAPTLQPDMATATALHATLTYNAVLFNETATAAALLPTQVPDTGFADDVGLPMMIGIAVLLVVVIFLARRLRTA